MARRKRINVKFLSILIGSVCLAALAIWIVPRYIMREDPKKYILLGDRAIKEGNAEEAVRFYKKASSLDPKNLDVIVRYGNAYHELAHTDPSVEGMDRDQWNRALQIDPTYIPALYRLMGADIDRIQQVTHPPAHYFAALRDIAGKILVINPKDLRAEAYLHIASLAGWIQGIETPDEQVNSDIDALTDLMHRDDSNTDVPYYIASAYIRQAQELRRVKSEQASHDKFAQAVALFDAATKAQPKNGVLYLRFYQILQTADNLDSSDDTSNEAAHYIPRMREVLEKARGCVTKDDAAFSDIYVQSAQFVARHDKRADAEALLHKLLDQLPNDQVARVALARLLATDPARRPEAIALLQKPIEDVGRSSSGAERNRSGVEWETYYDLTNYMIDQYSATTDPAKRAVLMASINDSYQRVEDKIRTSHGGDPNGLQALAMKLKAKIQLLGGDEAAAVKAIPTLTKAIDLLKVANANSRDWEMMYLLARAYYISRQTGEAKKILNEITEGVPNFVPARLMLTQLLIADNETEPALTQIGILDQIVPNEPEVGRLKLMCYSMLDPVKYKPLIELELNGIAERTRSEKIAKARACMVLGYQERAQVLLEDALKEEPGDASTVQLLVQIHMARKEKDKAIAIINGALATNPSNDVLKMMLLEVQGAPSGEIATLQLGAIAQIKDNIDRELHYFKFYHDEGKIDEAMKHLDAAAKIAPLDPRVLDLQFQVYAQSHDWPSADATVAKLADINADQAHGMIYRFRLAMAKGPYVKGEFDNATTIAQEMVRTLSEFARSWLSLAQVMQATGHYDDAISNYTIALQKQSENSEAIHGIIDCYYALNQPDDAIRYIRDGARTQPNNAYYREQLVLYDLNYGDPRNAIKPRLQARDAQPDVLAAWLNLGAAYFQVAQVALKPPTPNPAESAEAIRNAKQTFIDAIKRWPDEKVLYAWLADLSAFSKNFEEGEQALLTLSRRPAFKDQAEPLVMLADYYQRFGKFKEAEDAYKSALDRGNTSDVIARLASFYVQQKRFDDAIKLLKSAPATDHRLQVQLMDTLIQAGRLPEAEASLNKALAASPKDAQFLTMLGFIQMNSARAGKAMESLNKALDADPRYVLALYWRGNLRLRQSPPDTDGAIQDLSLARNIKPDYTEARLALAEAYRLKSSYDDAIHELETTLRLNPLNKEIRMKLIELYGAPQILRWADAERALRDAEQDPNLKSDPDWKRVEAQMWAMRKDFDKAVDAIAEARKMAASDITLVQDQLGILLQAKKYDELRQECTNWLQSPANPKLAKEAWWLWQLRAVADRKLDQKDQSIEDFDTALKIATAQRNDDATASVIQSIADNIGVDDAIRRVKDKAEQDPHWKVIEAALYFSKGDFPRAVVCVDAVLAHLDVLSASERDGTEALAGTIFMKGGEYDKAKVVYTELLKANPSDLVANNNMACIIGEYGTPPDPERALAYSQKAYDIMASRRFIDASILDTNGWMKCLAGHPEDGIGMIEEALKRRPVAETYYHLGEACLLMSPPQPAQAQTQLQKARDLIKDAQSKGQVVDLGLPAKVDQALVKVKQMQGQNQ